MAAMLAGRAKVPARRLAKDGSLLVADDVGNTVWRITAATPKR